MNCAILVSDESSQSQLVAPTLLLLGRPLAAYPLMVALSCVNIERVYVCTRRSELKELALWLGAQVLETPRSEVEMQDVVRACCEQIKGLLNSEGHELQSLVVLHENAVTITPKIIDEGLEVLASDTSLDSAITVSSSRQWSPRRAHQIGAGNVLETFLPPSADSSAMDEVWFPDDGATLVRSARIATGDWLGKTVFALRQSGGLAITETWHLAAAENWIKTYGLDMLFKARRTRWAHFYDSERSILSAVHLSNHSSVLDIGSDPGGLGYALRERFGLSSYTAVVPNAADRGEVLAICPDAKVIVGKTASIGRPEVDGFDLVSALGLVDIPELLESVLPAAFGQLMEYGSLIFNVRLTEGPCIEDMATSFQDISIGRGAGTRRAYVIRNLDAVMQAVTALKPARVLAHGYNGRPSPTATTPQKEVCFAVFAITRGGEIPPAVPMVDLQLPSGYSYPVA